MNPLAIYIYLIPLLFSIISCKKNIESNDQNSFMKNYELKKDFSFLEKKKVSLYIISDSPQGKVETKQVFEYTTEKKIIEVFKDGSLIFIRTPKRFTFEQHNVNPQANSLSQKIFYDSSSSIDSEIPQHLWTQAKEVGEELIIEISNQGKLISLKDTSRFKKNMFDKGKILFGEESFNNTQTLNQVEEYYKDSAIQERILSELDIFISLNDKPGKTWKKDNLIIGNIKQIYQYLYQSDEEGLAKINLEIDQKLINLNKNDNYSNFAYTKADGSSFGTIHLIKGLGWIHHGNIKQTLKYEMEMADPSSNKIIKYTTKYENLTEYSPTQK